MRLLLDEHFSPTVAAQLRRRRHDVIAARADANLHGLTDAALLAHATAERRALVTENVADFVELHRAAVVSGHRHYGIVFTSGRRYPRTTRAIGRLVRALDAFLDENRAEDALRRPGVVAVRILLRPRNRHNVGRSRQTPARPAAFRWRLMQDQEGIAWTRVRSTTAPRPTCRWAIS